MNITQICALKLRLIRESRNYTQEYVAGALNISQTTYCLLEKGNSKISLDRLEKIAALYNISVSELLSIQSQHVEIDYQGISIMNKFEKKMYEETIQRLEAEIEKLFTLFREFRPAAVGQKPE